MDYEELLWQTGFLPAVEQTEPEHAEAQVKALCDLGIRVFDISVRNPNFEAMAALVLKEKTRVLAVSGIQSMEEALKAFENGAGLLVSYTFQSEVADWCRERGLLYIPGCSTNSEIERALDKGLSTVLYAPCSSPVSCAGLYEIWKERGLRFLVSGGIGKENYLEFADKPYILAVRGSFFSREEAGGPADYQEIKRFAEKIYLANLGFELGHVGISTESETEGHELADALSDVFGNKAEHGHVGNWSLMRGIEVVNGKGPGVHGHIAVQCNNVSRAIYYLENRGHAVRRDSFRFRYPGRLSFAYLEEEFGGFAIHLMLRWTAP